MSEGTRGLVLLGGRLGPGDESRRIRGLVDRLAARSWAVRVICAASTGELGFESRVVECPGLNSFWQRPFAIRKLKAPDPGGAFRPEMIHVLHEDMAAAGLALAESWGVPYVQTIENFPPEGARLRLSRRWCRKLLVPLREVADDLIWGLKLPAELVAVVPPGLEVPSGCDRGNEVAGTTRVPVIGTAGPLVIGGGMTVFLMAARRIVEAGIQAEFVLAGRGPEEADLRRQAERLRIAERVTFAGPPSLGGPFWKVLDVFCQVPVVPTVGRNLASALASGVPSIASDVEGLRSWILPDSTGLVIPSGDPDALASAVLGLLKEPERAEGLGQQARAAIACRLDPDREAADLDSVYNLALHSNGGWPRPCPNPLSGAAA